MPSEVDRLKLYAKRRGLSQAQLARLTKVTPKYVNDIFRGRKGITKAFAYKLSRALNVSAAWLLFGVGDMQLPLEKGKVSSGERFLDALATEIEEARRTQRIEVIGKLAADAGSNVAYVEGEVLEILEVREDLPTYQVTGTSMAPVLWDGQYVRVDWEAWPNDGHLAAVELTDGRQFVKRFWDDGDKITLQSIRPIAPDRSERAEPDIQVPREQVKRAGRVRVHILY